MGITSMTNGKSRIIIRLFNLIEHQKYINKKKVNSVIKGKNELMYFCIFR